MGALVNLICIAVASFAVLAQPAVAQRTDNAGAREVNSTLPLTYPTQILQGGGIQTCPSDVQRGVTRNEVKNDTRSLLRESVVPLLQLQNSCGGSGWRRVVYLDMSDPSQQCPSAWREITTPHRTCGRRSGLRCEGVTYTTGTEQYDQVCGRIIGYQLGHVDSIYGSSINTNYLDGISVTHGSPRQHIWSFIGGYDEQSRSCPCVNGSTVGTYIPSFVGQNYFCESGLTRYSDGVNGPFFSNGDPLWDGQGCGPTSNCCTFNSPPWFNVQLPAPTTDYIEIRICSNVGISGEDTPIQLMEFYVK